MQWRRLITQQELCEEILGVNVSHFRRHRAALEQDGFPQPHPILRRYDPAHVFDYLDRNRPPESPSPANDADSHDPHTAMLIIADRMKGTANRGKA